MQCHMQLNGNTVASVPVKPDGTYTGSFLAPNPGTYGVTAAFKPSAGSTIGAGTSPSTPLTVGPAVAAITPTLSPNPAAPSSGVTDAGTVTTTSGTPDGGTVTVLVGHLSTLPPSCLMRQREYPSASCVLPHQVMAVGSEVVQRPLEQGCLRSSIKCHHCSIVEQHVTSMLQPCLAFSRVAKSSWCCRLLLCHAGAVSVIDKPPLQADSADTNLKRCCVHVCS